jgi:hypothetical protein
MMRNLKLGLICLCLTSCAAQSIKPVEYKTVNHLPDAALVVPCDCANDAISTNGDLAKALINARFQRDACAAQVEALGKWRIETAKLDTTPSQ